MATKNKPNELYITRVYDAPIKVVWDAWTDPEIKKKWWGPRGFTITTHSSDVRSGGTWDYTMHGPDGVDYPNTTQYLEVEKYKRMVYDHGGHKDRPPLFRVTVEFTETKGKTTMEMTMALATPEAAAEIKKFIKAASGNSTWDRLGEYLSETDRFIINRSFDAPISVMYDMWTDPKHLSQWLPPQGFNMKYITADFHVGGTSFYSMTGENGITMYGKAKYLEFEKPNRIVYVQWFCNEKGDVSRHPFAPTWPEAMHTTVTLSEEGPNQTRVTVAWEVYGEATPLERDTFHKAKSGMNQGWTGSFDKLDDLLATQK